MTVKNPTIEQIEYEIDCDLEVATQTEICVWRLLKALERSPGRPTFNRFAHKQIAKLREITARKDPLKKTVAFTVGGKEVKGSTLIIKRMANGS